MSPLPTSMDEVEALPAILLIAPRNFGKTYTLNEWTRVLDVYRVSRDRGSGALQLELVVRDGIHHVASGSISEYLVEVGEGRWLRVFDLPGEIVNRAERVDTEGTTSAAGTYQQLLLQRRPRVAGAILFTMPPALGDGVREPGYLHNTLQAEGDRQEVPLRPDEVQARFDDTMDFLVSFVGRSGQPGALPIAVQVGFADLTYWGAEPRPLAALEQLYQRIWPDTIGKPPFQPDAIVARQRAYPTVQGEVRRAARWLYQPRPEHAAQGEAPGAAYGERFDLWFYLEANGPSGIRLGPRNAAIGLLYLADRLHGRQVLDAAAREDAERLATRQRERSQRLQRLLAVVAAVVVVGGAVGAFAFHQVRLRQPWRLGEWMATRACAETTVAPAARCRCIAVLARARFGGTLEERVRALGGYEEGCWSRGEAEVKADEALRGLLLRLTAAHALVDPATLSIERLRRLGPPPRDDGDRYPATSEPEARALRWVIAAADPPGAPIARLAELVGAAEREAHPRFARLVLDAAASAGCLSDWAEARAGGDWRKAAASCGGAPLPPSLRACLQADQPLAGRRRAASAGLCDDRLCRPADGLAELLFPLPTGDTAIDYANLAASASSDDEFRKCMGHASGADPGHRLWLELLGPTPFPQRLQRAQGLDPASLQALSDFFKARWIALRPDGGSARMGEGAAARADHRLPRLPTRLATEAGCALVGVPEPFAGAASGPTWREAPFDPLDPEAPEVQRALLARRILDLEPGTRGLRWGGCQVTALATLLRVPTLRDGAIGGLQRAFAPLEATPLATIAQPARFLHCDLLARFESADQGPRFVASLVEGRKPAEWVAACGVRILLGRLARSAEIDPLFDSIRPALSDDDQTALAGLANQLELPDGGRDGSLVKESADRLRSRFPQPSLVAALDAALAVLQ